MIEHKTMKDVNGNVYFVKIQKPFVYETKKKNFKIKTENKECLLSYCNSYVILIKSFSDISCIVSLYISQNL